MTKVTYNYTIPGSIVISMTLIRQTLREVQAQLLSHEINGGGKKLSMNTVTEPNSCGMAACLGGWTSLILLGFDKTRDNKLEDAADGLFERLVSIDNTYGSKSGRLHDLFYNFAYTDDYDEPNVAATAIKRYLNGRKPWPNGEMPGIMPYTKRSRSKR